MDKKDVTIPRVVKSIDELILYKNNAKLHPPEQIEQIKNSIVEFGFVRPLLISSQNEIIAGHGRLMAAKELGYTELPCDIADHLSNAQIKAYRLADNKLSESGYDESLLKIEFDELKEMDFDLSLTGFDQADINFISGEESSYDSEFLGMPEYEQENLFKKQIIVKFMTNEDYLDFAKIINQKLTEKTKSIWFPKKDLISNDNDIIDDKNKNDE